MMLALTDGRLCRCQNARLAIAWDAMESSMEQLCTSHTRHAAPVLPVSDESLAQAERIIAAGGLVVIPTDTIYGIACNPTNNAAIDRLFTVKRRPRTKSLQVLLDSPDRLASLGLSLPAPLDVLAARFLPGPFSPICLAGVQCPLATVRVDDRTQAVRVPDSDVTRRIIAAVGPLAASSANISGGESCATVEQAKQQLSDSVDLYLDGGPTPGPVASTIVTADPTGADGIRMVREGVIKESAIRAALHAAVAARNADKEAHSKDFSKATA